MTKLEKGSRYALALGLVEKLGDVTYKKLMDHYATAEEVFNASIQKDLSISQYVATQLGSKKEILLKKADNILETHQRAGISVVPYKDARYPHRLRNIHNPPPILYTNQSLDFTNLNKQRSVAIVGSRAGTSYGKAFVKNLVAAFSEYGVIVVSGLAFGIDICAHQAALDHDLSTVGVLASGVDTIYPSAHKRIVAEMYTKGGVISEYSLGTQPERHYFPARNRIIAGLADAVIIVEAGEKSGALITATYANEFSRDVFALPGNITNTYSQGCLNLIKTHQAHMITSIEDLLYIMNWPERNAQVKKPLTLSQTLEALNDEERFVVKALHKKSPLDMGSLSEETQLTMERLSALILQLEIKKRIRSLPGDQYELCS